MNRIKHKPYARIMNKERLAKILPKELREQLDGDDIDMYGVVIEIKAIDKLDTPVLFMDYAFGEKGSQSHRGKNNG